MFDDSVHPDLEDISLRLDRRMREVLRLEQESAAVEARRLSFLRDRLIELEDRRCRVHVVLQSGESYDGELLVGLDHLEVWGQTRALVHLDDVLAVEFL